MAASLGTDNRGGITFTQLMTARPRPLPISAVVALAVAPAALAVPSSLSDAVPKDAVAAYLADSSRAGKPESNAGSSLGLATFVIDQAHELGLLSGLDLQCRAWFDALASASVVVEHPYALVLLDVRAAGLVDGGHRLAGLHAALIVHTGGANRAIEGRIQHLLNIYTNSLESTLTTQTGEHGAVFTLGDRRLPQWTVLTWGPVGELYVVAIGEGSFRRIEDVLADRSLSLTGDAWFGGAFEAAGGSSAAVAVYARPDRLYLEADDLFAAKIDRVRREMRAHDVDRGLWTLAFTGRSLEARQYLHRNGADQLRSLTGHHLAGVPEHRIIPAECTGYIILDLTPQALCDTVCEAYMAARSPEARRWLRAYWRNVQAKAEVSIAEDIITHLGRGAAIYDYPPHALRLPLAWTIVLPIEGDATELRKSVDRLAGVWAEELAEAGSLRLQRDPDGIWYLFFGINGPAIGLTDRWLVVSFSPEAVRRNTSHLALVEPPTAAGLLPAGDQQP